MLGLRGFPNVQGGVETYAENIAPLLVEHGFDVQVVTRSPYVPRELTCWRGVHLTRIWCPRSTALEAIVHTFLGVLYSAWTRPDVVHIQAIGPALLTPLARLFGLSVVVTHHGQDYQRQKWGFVARAILRLGEWMGMRFANRRIAVSDAIQRSVSARFGVDCSVIHNGVTVHPPATTDGILKKHGLVRGKYILLVARWVPEKRHEDLIEAFALARLTDWKLVLAGGADHSSAYAQLLSRLVSETPNVIAAGFVSGLPLRELYSHAGIFVLPSSHEGLPIALLEALSYGVPAMASDIDANREVGLDDTNYFHVGDVATLAEKLRTQSAHIPAAGDRDRIIQSIQDRFSWHRNAEQTAAVFLSAVDHR